MKIEEEGYCTPNVWTALLFADKTYETMAWPEPYPRAIEAVTGRFFTAVPELHRKKVRLNKMKNTQVLLQTKRFRSSQ